MLAGSDGAAASTYRLQLGPDFDFATAAGVVPYLADLGITHVYLSPLFEAQPGSTHGYDVIDPRRLRGELGGVAGFRQLEAALGAYGLRAVLDIVPNHMAATPENPAWRDVQEKGRDSAWAYLFDIDWETGEYRRFFEIDSLVALRQEDPAVFDETHALVATLAARPAVAALRVDHVDGLRDPRGYLERLHALAPDTSLIVEKILEGGELVPPEWPVIGTTGYEFANRVLGVFIDNDGRDAFDSLYVDLTGDRRTWPEAVRAAKRHVLETRLAPDVARVARSFGDPQLAPVITALAVEWPVYRTYTRAGDVSVADFAIIESTCARVRALLPDHTHAIDTVERALLRQSDQHEGADRFQMLTGPAMAKGVEDRAFYDYTRFVALNEVGGNPGAFGLPLSEWHAACEHVVETAPRGLLTTATHDTKRGEDVRARLAALTERPEWWCEVASKWMTQHNGIDGPTAYLLLQTLVGAWPVSEERLEAYMQKAVREAGRYTSWAEPDADYEAAVTAEVRAALRDPAAIDALVHPVLHAGRVNALAQTLLRLTAPGTPDTYQGTEWWDLSLVDPDNRRAVDFAARADMLRAQTGDSWSKMAVIAAALAARRDFPAAFTGAYRPLRTDDESVLAFARGDDVAVVVPVRHEVRGSVALPPHEWTNRLTGERVQGGPVAATDLFARFPVALMCR